MIDAISYDIGHSVLGMAILCVGVWLCARIPIFGLLLKVLCLLSWGSLTVGGPLFVAFAIDIPENHYWAAGLTLVLGLLIGSFWFVIGLPELIRSLKDRENYRWWRED